MSAASDHRAGVFDRWGNRCYVEGPDCAGRLQAAHFIAAQVLKRQRSQVRVRVNKGELLPRWTRQILAPLDELLSDGRNGVPLCEFHHGRFDRMGLRIPPPACVIAFAEEFGLSHLLEIQIDNEEAA